jgi:hypothetical protein
MSPAVPTIRPLDSNGTYLPLASRLHTSGSSALRTPAVSCLALRRHQATRRAASVPLQPHCSRTVHLTRPQPTSLLVHRVKEGLLRGEPVEALLPLKSARPILTCGCPVSSLRCCPTDWPKTRRVGAPTDLRTTAEGRQRAVGGWLTSESSTTLSLYSMLTWESSESDQPTYGRERRVWWPLCNTLDVGSSDPEPGRLPLMPLSRLAPQNISRPMAAHRTYCFCHRKQHARRASNPTLSDFSTVHSTSAWAKSRLSRRSPTCQGVGERCEQTCLSVYLMQAAVGAAQ